LRENNFYDPTDNLELSKGLIKITEHISR